MVFRLLGILLGILIVILIISFFGFQEVATVIAKSDLQYIIAAIVLQLTILLLTAFRLKVIASIYGNIPFGMAIKTSILGTFVGLITPFSRIGGEPVKAYILKERLGVSRASASIVLDSITEVLSSVVVVFFVLLLFYSILPAVIQTALLLFLLVVSFLTVVTLKIIFHERLMIKIVLWLTRRIKRWKDVDGLNHLRNFYASFDVMIKDKKIAASATIISLVMKLLEFARLYVILLALGQIIPLKIIAILWSIILVLLLVPWLPGSVGLVELGGASALILFGLDKHVAISALILDRFVSFWLILGIGTLALWHYGYSLSGILKSKQKVEIKPGQVQQVE